MGGKNHPLRPLQRFGEQSILIAVHRKLDAEVEQDLAGVGLGQSIDQLRMHRTRPRPPPKLHLAFIVDLEDDDVAARGHRQDAVARDPEAVLERLAHSGDPEQ